MIACARAIQIWLCTDSHQHHRIIEYDKYAEKVALLIENTHTKHEKKDKKRNKSK